MSVGLFMYDRDRHDHDAQLVLMRAVASQWKYKMYFEPAIKELHIVFFQDGAEIRKGDLEIVNDEIERLIVWFKENIPKEEDYLIDRLVDLKTDINENLLTEDDVLYLF